MVLLLGVLTFRSAGTIEMSGSAMTVVGIALVILLAIIWRRGRANARLAEKNQEFSAALRQSECKLKESETAFRRADSKVAELQFQVSSLIREATANKPVSAANETRSFSLPPNGAEVFLPPLDPRRVYQITIQGACRFSESAGWFAKRGARADAMYRTDQLGNFLKIHDFVKLKDTPIRRFLTGVPPEAMPKEDRKAHVYKFRIDGCAKKVSAQFLIASEELSDVTNDPLMLTVELLPVGTPSPAAGALREEAAREKASESERVARENAKRAEQAAKETTALRAKLESLRRQARFESHFLDPKFQEDFAKRDPTEILKTRNPEWRKEYCQFMKDVPLKSLAEEQAPEVIQWLEARVKIAQLAERFAVAPLSENKKPKLKAKEVRQLIVRREAIQVDDKIARAKLKGEKIAEAKAEMDALPLDDDEKERLKTELVQTIFEEGEEHGKDGDTL